MFLYGRCYDLGDGVEQDYKKALEWYQRAADAGDEVAMYNVGIFYLQGYIVKQDNKKALEWLGKAADKDYQDAKDVIKVYGPG